MSNARRPSIPASPSLEERGAPKKSKASTPSRSGEGSPSKGKSDSAKPQYGRRSSRRNSAGTHNEEGGQRTGVNAEARHHRVKDAVPENLRTVADEETDATASAALVAKQREEKEKLARAVAETPTGYQAQMPRLTDLDIKNNWDRLLQSIHGEFDMTCLTACLARELDEDVAWNPDMLLVQLTSDLHDAAEQQGTDVNLAPVEESEIGQMTGGEVTRRRKEKGSADESPAIPSSGVAKTTTGNLVGGNGAPSPSKRKASTSKSGGGTAAGAGHSTTSSVNAPTPSAKRKLSAKEGSPRKASAASSVNKAGMVKRKSRDSSVATQLRNAPEL